MNLVALWGIGKLLPSRVKDWNWICVRTLDLGSHFKIIQLSTKFCKDDWTQIHQKVISRYDDDDDDDDDLRWFMTYLEILLRHKNVHTHTHGVKLVQWWPSRNLRPTLSPAVCPLTLRELTTGAREGGMFFSDSCIPQNLIDSHGFSNSQNFVGWCTPLPDGSKFFLEHDKGTRTFWSFFRCL